ncbi:hypothetical protein PR202_ga14252 [Eleusine coracana subsp. coracana]|uniref:LisH domain-containing protein n=1 Tax=Eleusine coracana subsp. coracana TaxID=191504 RepID=A0AAV5CGW5_ELECO|nr:hypothetical protein PR202_ga14252 [Eleusine coracana subsp. coracana]
MARTDWEADKMLDVYIYAYLVKRNLQATAKAFISEGKVATDPVAIDAPGGFLFEWWSIFWDIFHSTTKSSSSSSSVSLNNNNPMMLQHPPPGSGPGINSSDVTAVLASKMMMQDRLRHPNSDHHHLLDPNTRMALLTKSPPPNHQSHSGFTREISSNPTAFATADSPEKSAATFEDGPNAAVLRPSGSQNCPISRNRYITVHSYVGLSLSEVGNNRTSTNKVVCCHFSTDGKLLASAGHEKKVKCGPDNLEFEFLTSDSLSCSKSLAMLKQTTLVLLVTAPPSTSWCSPSSPAWWARRPSSPTKLAGIHHVRSWRGDSLATSAASALIAWAITALAFGLACKEIHIGGHRGWRLRVLEAFVIILGITQLIYVLMLHMGLFTNNHGHPAGHYPPADYAGEPKPTARV